MGAKTPAEGGETKPIAKHGGRSNNQNGGRHNVNLRDNYIKKEKFVEADPDLCGHVFEANHNQTEQVTNFTTVDNIIKAQVRTECDSFVLASLEIEVESDPKESTPVTAENSSMTKRKEMKCKSKYNKYLNQIHRVEMQLKQTYSKFMDRSMKE